MISKILSEYSESVNNYCDKILSYHSTLLQKDVIDAMRYSVISTGKKVRPALVFEFAKVCGQDDINVALPFACAVEMVHSYSLIHDDLPCMDNDDFRRGKPSCHKAFGEDIALLAGDALLSLAFETITKSAGMIQNSSIVNAVRCLAECSGAMGMVGGQVIDLQSENKQIDLNTLQQMHKGKTGMMIRCSALLGCYAAEATKEQTDAAIMYADKIGMVFQIIDDVLDVVADEKLLGKPVGSDKSNNKTTYATLFSVDECYKMADELTRDAKQVVTSAFGDKASNLCELADMLLNRKY